MSATKVKKVRKYRGSKTHGGGAMKKRRGAGSRAGRGRAGSGKRGDAKKPSYWKSWRPGKHGFSNPTRDVVVSINVSDLDKHLDWFISNGFASKSGDVIEVDLTKAGYDKLLGSGRISSKVNVFVGEATERAVDKVESAGGSVVLPADKN